MTKINNNASSFMNGALVLVLANFLVKVIGAIFKIPLANIVGKSGMGYFGVAYQIYTFMFIISTAGLPIAISKMVSESLAKNDESEARRVFRVALALLSFVGVIGSVLLFVFSGNIAKMLGSEGASFGIKLISPAVYFVSVLSAYRGYFQGKQNMYPTAISEVIEALGKLVIGYGLVRFFAYSSAANKIKFFLNSFSGSANRYVGPLPAVSGAVLGVTAGTFLALISMLIINYFAKIKSKIAGEKKRSVSEILRELMFTSVPIMVGAAVFSLTGLIDLVTVMNRLVVNPGVFRRYAHVFAAGTQFAENALKNNWSPSQLLQEKANTLYGMYTGFAMPIFNMPLTLVVAVAVSIVPAIASSIVRNVEAKGQEITEGALRLTMFFAAPCAFGISFLAAPILKLIYNDSDSDILLQKLSLAIVFVALVQVTNAVLQAYGRPYVPLKNMLIGGMFKILINYFFIPWWGIDAAPIATNVCYAVIFLMNMQVIMKYIKLNIDLIDFIIKPICSAAAMGFLVLWLHSFFERAGVWSAVSVGASICMGGVAYTAMIVGSGAVKYGDILMLPLGNKIERMFRKFNLLG